MSEINSADKKLLENVQQYYQQLATEAKKKHPPIKEVTNRLMPFLLIISFLSIDFYLSVFFFRRPNQELLK